MHGICLFCILHVGTDDVLTVHNFVEIWSCIPSKVNEINLLTRGLDMVPCKYFKFSK